MKSPMRIVPALLLIGLLAGCTTTSVSDIFAVETVPDTQTGALKTGTYPEIGDVPVAETKQLSGAQTAAEKRGLAQAASRGRSQAAADNQASYNREIADLRRLAEEQKKRRAAVLEAAPE